MNAIVSNLHPPVIEFLMQDTVFVPAQMHAESLTLRYQVNRVAEARLVFKSAGHGMANLARWQGEVSRFETGNRMALRVRGGQVLFAGVIAKKEVELTIEAASLTVTLRHALQKLGSTHRSRVFAQRSDADVVRAMLAEHDIKADPFQGMDQFEHEQLVQHASSDLNFLRARLRANNVWLLPTVNGVQLFSPKVAGKATHVLNAERAETDIWIEQARWMTDSVDLPGTVAVRGWDVAAQRQSEEKPGNTALGSKALDPGRLKPLTEGPWEASYSVPVAPAEALALANGRWHERLMHALRGSFTVMGSSAYAIGDTVEIKGFGSGLDGNAIVTGVRHEIVSDTWRSVLDIGLDELDGIDAPMVPAIGGMHVGTVSAYQDDPSGQNRLRVHVPVLGLPANASLWARLASPYASKEGGLTLYPEPGDEVVIGFFNGDPRHPVVLGAMHNPKNPSPYPLGADGSDFKGLMIKKDGRMFYWEMDTAEGVVRLGIDEAALSVNKDGQVAVAGQEVAIEATGQVAIETDKVTIAGSSSVDVTSASIDLKNS